jgi:hypothetical protein
MIRSQPHDHARMAQILNTRDLIVTVNRKMDDHGLTPPKRYPWSNRYRPNSDGRQGGRLLPPPCPGGGGASTARHSSPVNTQFEDSPHEPRHWPELSYGPPIVNSLAVLPSWITRPTFLPTAHEGEGATALLGPPAIDSTPTHQMRQPPTSGSRP